MPAAATTVPAAATTVPTTAMAATPVATAAMSTATVTATASAATTVTAAMTATAAAGKFNAQLPRPERFLIEGVECCQGDVGDFLVVEAWAWGIIGSRELSARELRGRRRGRCAGRRC
jgi:hypothetical protein